MFDAELHHPQTSAWPLGSGSLGAIESAPLAAVRRVSACNDRASLESLAFRHGSTYDSYLATESDREIFWAHGFAGAVAYRRDRRYVHVAGGMLTPPYAKAELLSQIVRWADSERLQLSFYNLTDDDVPLARRFGFQVTKWGEEALVDLPGRDWSGKPFEWLRRQTNFCRRQRLVVRTCDRARLSAAQWRGIAAELTEISHALLVNKPQREEIHFLEGRFDPDHLGRRRLFVAQSDEGNGRIEGFLLCNPCRDGTLWAFETYRRRPDAVRGTMPFLMHQAMRQLQAEGVPAVSLCLVPGLRCETPLEGDSPLARWSVVIATRYFNFIHDTRGMYHFKSRFRPRFVNRYLAVRPGLSLGSAWSFVRVLGVLDLQVGNLVRRSAQRLRTAAARRTLSRPAPDMAG
jgi:phosphatidylglycerol lysyltransferase